MRCSIDNRASAWTVRAMKSKPPDQSIADELRAQTVGTFPDYMKAKIDFCVGKKIYTIQGQDKCYVIIKFGTIVL